MAAGPDCVLFHLAWGELPFMTKHLKLAPLLSGLLCAQGALALDLITDAEARLPAAQADARRAGLTRGPGIDVDSPAASVPKNAVALKVGFKPRGGAEIDPKTVRVLYMKNPQVDLTERVRAGISGNGIVVDGATVPAGEHQLRIEVADTEGRTSSRLVGFKAQ
jgi:hypothetical protein